MQTKTAPQSPCEAAPGEGGFDSLQPVVLLHGLGHRPLMMRKMARALSAAGWNTLNLGYPSHSHPIETLAENVWNAILDHFSESAGPFNFVTHSMGGIVLRQMAANHPGCVHRAVMLAPPNQGSEWVALARRSRLLRWFVGPAGMQLGCDPESLPNSLGPARFQLGVIAGSHPDNPLARLVIPGESDGRVSVPHTKLPGMAALLVVRHGHLLLMLHDDVIRQTEHFLRTGSFDAS